MPSAEDIQGVYERYVSAWARRDLDGATAIFASKAVLHDPVDGPVYEGVDKIREFFAGGIGGIRACKLASPVHISGDCRHAAASTYTEIEIGQGIKVIETMDVMTFDDDGLVTAMTAYWGPTNFRDLQRPIGT